MKKIIVYFLFLPLLSTAQTKQFLYNHLRTEIGSNNICVHYTHEKRVYKKFKIIIKTANFKNTSFPFVSNKIEGLIKSTLADCDTEGTMDIDIEVKTLSPNFISILSKTEFDCKQSPHGFFVTETLNYLKVGKQIFAVKINPEIGTDKELISNINKELDEDCQEEFKNSVFSGQIVFFQGKGLIVNPVYLYSCYVEVPVKPDSKYLIFQKMK